MARGTSNYIPRRDGHFSAWAQHYYAAVEKWWAGNGFDESELKPLKEVLSVWVAAFDAHVKAQAAAEVARQAKDAARAALEKQVRPVTNFVQGWPKTTNADRAEMGITMRDASPMPAPAPSSRPLMVVGEGGRLTHHLRLVDETTPTRGRRPAGVQRVEVFVAFTAPGQPAPNDPREYRSIGSITRGETTLSFESDKGGMQAHYLTRWVSTSGAIGPWSETASATVAA